MAKKSLPASEDNAATALPTRASKLIMFGSESAFLEIDHDPLSSPTKLALLSKSIIGLQRAVAIAKREDESFLVEEADEAFIGIELISSFTAALAEMHYAETETP